MTSSAPNACVQWVKLEDSELTLQNIDALLTSVPDDLWVAAACADRVVEDVDVQRSLLDLGLKRTEQARNRAREYLEDALIPAEDEESEDVARGSAGDKSVTSLTSYFHNEPTDGRLCHLRSVLLSRLDRLNTFVEMRKLTPKKKSSASVETDEEWDDDPWGDTEDASEQSQPAVSAQPDLPVTLSTFLLDDLLDIACLLASASCFTSLRILHERHGSELWLYRFTILEYIPDYAPPTDYRELLPSCDPVSELERRPPCIPWREEPDWTEQAAVHSAFSAVGFVPSEPEPSFDRVAHAEPLSSTALAQWYRDRTEHIIFTAGMVDHALLLVQHAASQGVANLDGLGEDLLLFSRLVYDASSPDGTGSEDWTLVGWRSLDPPAAIHAYLANSTAKSIAKDISRLVMPYLFILEARAERAGQPDPGLPQRLLYEFILQASLDIVAAIFEASKPTLPPAQRVIRSDEDMARLALACLYGSDSLDEWPTMSRIFECLPAWDVSPGNDESDEADTTVTSLSTFVAPSTTRPRCTPSDLLLFFKPLPPSSLSRALDILDVHLESGEILARWSVPAPLRWFLQSNTSVTEQRAWATRMARRAGGTDDKLESQEDWEWLLEDMLKLARSGDGTLKGAFCLLSRDEVTRIFLGGLLASGHYTIAKAMIHNRAVKLDPAAVEEICLATSQELYDNASDGNYHFGDMKLAYDCLNVPPPSDRIHREKDFIEATTRLCSFKLTSRPGIPITPIEIRLTKDRLSLVSRVLASNADAYKHTQVILELVRKLGFDHDVVAEVKTLAMLADTALSSGDFDRAYENSMKLVDKVSALKASRGTSDAEVEQTIDVCWVSCLQLGRHPEFEDLEKKMYLLGRTMELCPADRLVDVLSAWRREEANDLDARRERLATRGTNNRGLRSDGKAKKHTAVASHGEHLQKLRMSTPHLPHAPDAASLANKAFHSVAANFPFSVASRGRSLFSDETERSRSGSGSRASNEGVEVQATRVLQKGLGWLLGEED